MNQIYNRRTKEYEPNTQYGGGALRFLYETVPGRVLLKLAVSPVVSRISGWYNHSGLSRGKIEKFVRQYKIPMEKFENREFTSFADFFTRKRKTLAVEQAPEKLISPADGKLLVYRVEEDLQLQIKHSTYTLQELLGFEFAKSAEKSARKCDEACNAKHDGTVSVRTSVPEDFRNGYCMVLRLSMEDYHRYCFPDSGRVKRFYEIKGQLHTVSSFSEKHKVFARNHRICNELETEHFGTLWMIEVGALLVGKIQNHPVTEFQKGDEKGYFELGGSTIILLVQGDITVDEDILTNSGQGIETKVCYGEQIGVKAKK